MNIDDVDSIKTKIMISINAFLHEITTILTCQMKAILNFFVYNVWSPSIFTVFRKQYFFFDLQMYNGKVQHIVDHVKKLESADSNPHA